MKLARSGRWLTACAVAATLVVPAVAQAAAIELSLVIDSSGSINEAEWALQQQGYANALGNVSVAMDGSVAISIVRFATNAQLVMNMMTINSAADLQTIRDTLLNLGWAGNGLNQVIGGGTCISCGIEMGHNTLTATATLRSLIDVSTDGFFTRGADPAGGAGVVGTAAWAVANNATAVNALGIGVFPAFASGPGSFNLVASDFGQFQSTLEDKLAREIGSVPEPTLLTLFGVAFLAGGRRVWRTRVAR